MNTVLVAAPKLPATQNSGLNHFFVMNVSFRMSVRNPFGGAGITYPCRKAGTCEPSACRTLSNAMNVVGRRHQRANLHLMLFLPILQRDANEHVAGGIGITRP